VNDGNGGFLQIAGVAQIVGKIRSADNAVVGAKFQRSGSLPIAAVGGYFPKVPTADTAHLIANIGGADVTDIPTHIV
jgi:hypothetical protein